MCVSHLLFRPVLIDSNFGGAFICMDQVFEYCLLVHHRAAKALIVWPSLGFEAYHVEGEMFGCHYPLDQICEIMLSSPSEQDGESVILLDAEFHELHLCLMSHNLDTHTRNALSVHSTNPPRL